MSSVSRTKLSEDSKRLSLGQFLQLVCDAQNLKVNKPDPLQKQSFFLGLWTPFVSGTYLILWIWSNGRLHLWRSNPFETCLHTVSSA